MILEYHRPDTVEEALELLRRTSPKTIPVGGGTSLRLIYKDCDVAVVDLQSLPLDTIEALPDRLEIGGVARLQALVDEPMTPAALREALLLETSINQRRMATMAGTIVACDGRSAVVTVLLAMDVTLIWFPKQETVQIGNFLPLRDHWSGGLLLSRISIPGGVKVAFAVTNRTPADKPLVCAAVCQWPSGRTRVALGGHGMAPMLAMDGPEATGSELAARAAYKQAGDEWASADFRSDVAARLTRRLVASLGRLS